MTLLEIAKKFSDGFKEGWQECQADDKTEWQDDEQVGLEETSYHELTLFPAYDEIDDVAHRNFYPDHPLYK